MIPFIIYTHALDCLRLQFDGFHGIMHNSIILYADFKYPGQHLFNVNL